jgi:membrane dipeptidase
MNPNYIPIIDGHNDTILDLHLAERGQERNFFSQSEHGHIDLPRARLGGLAGGFFALFAPSPKDVTASLPHPETGEDILMPAAAEHEEALRFTLAMAARLFRLEAKPRDRSRWFGRSPNWPIAWSATSWP